MRGLVATVMAVLGTLLVLAGASAIVSRAWTVNASDAGDTTVATGIGAKPTTSARLLGVGQRLQGADRLIAWGALLLLMAAVAAGTISFAINAGSVK